MDETRWQQEEVTKSVTRRLAVHGASLTHRWLPDEQQPWKDVGISGREGVKLDADWSYVEGIKCDVTGQMQ